MDIVGVLLVLGGGDETRDTEPTAGVTGDEGDIGEGN